MKVQYHVNQYPDRPNAWPRCNEVSVREATVVCDLSFDRAYDLTTAYALDPHLKLIQCETDEQIASFVRTWGPLHFSLYEYQRGVCSAPLSQYRTFREWLRSFVNMLGAYKGSRNEPEALQEFLNAETDEWRSSTLARPGSESLLVSGLRVQFGIKDDVSTWIKNSSLGNVRSALEFLLSATSFGGSPGLDCIRRAGKKVVEARWKLNSLEEALRWMIWYDQFKQHPLICCEACRKVFRSETAHARKYCSYECAHRIAARKWQRNRKKTAEVKRGTRKAR